MSKVWTFFYFQALDQDPTEKNRQNTAAAIKPLTEAVENLTTFASSPEFASIPAKISPKVFNIFKIWNNFYNFNYYYFIVLLFIYFILLCKIEIVLMLINIFIPIVFVIHILMKFCFYVLFILLFPEKFLPVFYLWNLRNYLQYLRKKLLF